MIALTADNFRFVDRHGRQIGSTWRVIGSSLFESAVVENLGLAVGISFLSVIRRWIRGFTLVTVFSLYFHKKNTDSTCRFIGLHGHETKQMIDYNRGHL
jgi:hypothetical protein